MRRRNVAVLAVVAWAVPAVAAAQPALTFEVPVEGETTLLFYSGDEGGEALPISIQGVLSDGSTDYQEVCTTPCAYRVPNGAFRFMAGSRREFVVAAAGGVQQWQVEDNSLGGIIAGAALTGLGAGLLVPGGLAIVGLLGGGLEDPSLSNNVLVALGQIVGWTFIGIGAAMTVPGVIVWASAYGYADMTPRPDLAAGAPPMARGPLLVPGLMTGQAIDGSRVWGLNLTLVF